MSKDPRDVALVTMPVNQAAMQRGDWFCCHVNMGMCHGAALLHAKHLVRQSNRKEIAHAKGV